MGLEAERFGRRAETLCVWLLRLTGWRIVARRFVSGRGTGAGEVDVIARRGGVLAFIEVKARARLDDAAYAITPRQRQRILRGAQVFMKQHPDLAGLSMRFDAMLAVPRRLPRHVADAWRP